MFMPSIDVYRPIDTDGQRNEIFLVEFENMFKLSDEAVLITMIEEWHDWTECYPDIVNFKKLVDRSKEIEYNKLINNVNSVSIVRDPSDYEKEADILKYKCILPFISDVPLFVLLKQLNSKLDYDEIKKDIDDVRQYATYKYNSTLVFEESIRHLKNIGIIKDIIFFNNPFTDEMVKYCKDKFPNDLETTIFADDGDLKEVFISYPQATTICCKSIDDLYDLITTTDKKLIKDKQFLVSCMGINYIGNREIKHFEFFKSLYKDYGANVEFVAPKISCGPDWSGKILTQGGK